MMEQRTSGRANSQHRPRDPRRAHRASDVIFRYPNASRPSLSELNVKIEPGERIGIIGRVASGKSTLGRVLCGLYPPSEGEMLVDGLDSRQYHPHQLREAFRFVSQDADVFSGTVRDNLMLGAAQADDNQLIDAVVRSGADIFLSRDAAGFDLPVGERGSRLSGGQRSLLVLARALVSPSRILFLDEPTGSMDTADRTVLHRASEDGARRPTSRSSSRPIATTCCRS